jgi:hypothetical protein
MPLVPPSHFMSAQGQGPASRVRNGSTMRKTRTPCRKQKPSMESQFHLPTPKEAK